MTPNAIEIHDLHRSFGTVRAVDGLNLTIGTRESVAVLGDLADGDSSYSLTLAAWFVLPAIGGLWMPLSILPKALRTIGHVLPTNRLGDLGWRIAGGHAPSASSGLILAGWTAAFALAAPGATGEPA